MEEEEVKPYPNVLKAKRIMDPYATRNAEMAIMETVLYVGKIAPQVSEMMAPIASSHHHGEEVVDLGEVLVKERTPKDAIRVVFYGILNVVKISEVLGAAYALRSVLKA